MKPHTAVFLLLPKGSATSILYTAAHADEILKSRNTMIDIGIFFNH